MSSTVQSYANQLLAALPEPDLGRLRALMKPVDLPLQMNLGNADASIKTVYFLESGLASIVTPKDRIVEVGLVGHEGFIGVPLLLGFSSSPFRTFMQAAGQGYSLGRDEFAAALHDSDRLRALLLRYVGAQMVQTAQAAACNGMHPVRQRLAKWLLLSHDRLLANSLPLTHEFMSFMLGVRRASISDTMKLLEEAGALHQGHGRILVLDRTKLEAESCSCYKIIKNEYSKVPTGYNPHETPSQPRSAKRILEDKLI